MTYPEKVEQFRKLHAGPRILLLPNAWDVVSARIFEDAGFPAIGTTSAGVASALGYADGQHIAGEDMLQAVYRIASAVSVPVTADIESGYQDPLRTARQVVEAGAVGLNLEDEDGLADLDRQVSLIRAIRAGTHLVINARSDIFLARVGDEGTRFERTVQRLNAFREAGADCLFAPGVRDAETIARLVDAVHGPLNILATAGTPAVAELERMGVARVSVGSGPARAALGLVRRIAAELRDQGTYEAMTVGAMPYAEVNGLFGERAG